MKEEQAYTVDNDEFTGRTRLSHPSLGAIKVFRTSGGRRLNGSDFTHHHYVSIEIDTAMIHRDLAHDWHFPGKPIVRFCMSESQWAHFVSSIGMGEGTLITFDHRPTDGYKTMVCPEIPNRDESKVLTDEGLSAINGALRDLEALDKAVRGELSGVTKVKQDRLIRYVLAAHRKLSDVLPFIESSFMKRMEERVIKAKTEVAAWTESFIRRTGIKALQGKSPLTLDHDEDRT